MTSIIDFIIIGTINGVVSATILILNDRIFKRQVEKVFDHFEKVMKERLNGNTIKEV